MSLSRELEKIDYRIAVESDAEDLVKLLRELGYEATRTEVLQRIQHIQRNGGFVLVAEEGAKVVGSINVIIDIRLAEGVAGEIVSLVVTRDYQGQGIGRELVRRSEALASKDCPFFRVRANTKRHDAHQFYKSIGFTEIKSQKIFKKETKR